MVGLKTAGGESLRSNHFTLPIFKKQLSHRTYMMRLSVFIDVACTLYFLIIVWEPWKMKPRKTAQSTSPHPGTILVAQNRNKSTAARWWSQRTSGRITGFVHSRKRAKEIPWTSFDPKSEKLINRTICWRFWDVIWAIMLKRFMESPLMSAMRLFQGGGSKIPRNLVFHKECRPLVLHPLSPPPGVPNWTSFSQPQNNLRVKAHCKANGTRAPRASLFEAKT